MDHNSIKSSGYGSKENDSHSDISERSVTRNDNEEEDDLNSEASISHKRKQKKKKLKSKTKKDEEVVLDVSKLSTQSSSSSSVQQITKSFEDLSSSKTIQSEAYFSDSDPVLYQKNTKYVDSVQIGLRRARSLETVQEVSDESESPVKEGNKAATPVPSPIWPNVSDLSKTLQRQHDRIHSRRQNDLRKVQRSTSLDIDNHRPVIRFNPLVSVVTQNSRYVTAISVSPNKHKPPSPKTFNIPRTGEKITYFSNNGESSQLQDLNEEEERLARYFSNNNKGDGEIGYPIMSLQPDSLVTEDTLKMMTYPDYNPDESHPSPIVPKSAYHGDALGQIMYTRGLYATLNRNSLLQNENLVQHPFRHKKSSACRKLLNKKTNSISTKKKGLDTVRDLWEKTGMKTNGRKLMVDLEEAPVSEAQNVNRMADSYRNDFSGAFASEQTSGSCKGFCRVNGLGDCDCNPGRQMKLGAPTSYLNRINSLNHDENSRSLSSMSISSSDKYRKNFPSMMSSSSRGTSLSENPNNSMPGTSFDNFGIDNFAFLDDTGNRSTALNVIKNGANYQSYGGTGDQNSELQEVVIDRKNKLPGHAQRVGEETRGVWTTANAVQTRQV